MDLPVFIFSFVAWATAGLFRLWEKKFEISVSVVAGVSNAQVTGK